MPRPSDPDLAKRLQNRALIDGGLSDGVQAALRRHKQAGVPIAVWQDGQVVLIAADQIQLKETSHDIPKARP